MYSQSAHICTLPYMEGVLYFCVYMYNGTSVQWSLTSLLKPPTCTCTCGSSPKWCNWIHLHLCKPAISLQQPPMFGPLVAVIMWFQCAVHSEVVSGVGHKWNYAAVSYEAPKTHAVHTRHRIILVTVISALVLRSAGHSIFTKQNSSLAFYKAKSFTKQLSFLQSRTAA